MLVQYPSVLDLKKFKKAADRKAKRKAKRNKATRLEHQIEHGLGTWSIAKTVCGIVPFNFGGVTTYLIGSGITVLAEKSKQGYWIYLTNCRNVTSKAQLQELLDSKAIKKRVSARRCELSFIKQLPDFK